MSTTTASSSSLSTNHSSSTPSASTTATTALSSSEVSIVDSTSQNSTQSLFQNTQDLDDGLSEEVPLHQIIWEIVERYYTTFYLEPNQLHRFYKKESTALHGFEGVNSEVYEGQAGIRQLISNHNFKNSKVMISNIDFQKIGDVDILVQIIGEFAKANEPSQKFVQSFVLSSYESQNSSYFIRNDVLRFLREDLPSEIGDYDESPASTVVDSEAVQLKVPEPSSTSNSIETSKAFESPNGPISAEFSSDNDLKQISHTVDSSVTTLIASKSELLNESQEVNLDETTQETAETFEHPSSSESFVELIDDTEKLSSEKSVDKSGNESTVISAVAPLVDVGNEVNSDSVVSESHINPDSIAAFEPPLSIPTGPASTSSSQEPISTFENMELKEDSDERVSLSASSIPATWASVARTHIGNGTPAPSIVSQKAPLISRPQPKPQPTISPRATNGNVIGPKEFFSVYIKMTENMDLTGLRNALERFGQVTHFDPQRTRGAVFVDFKTEEDMLRALDAKEVVQQQQQ
ncbi:uncharacterized protein SAPINGB_P003860 [Magnusiomyces paraingens]|uniref:NTF2 domain-containing protein n=1 Tax=Magnusiomyces paraingens TaxID=2606893 RepID=A0A5E8BWY1_9ASCO|nr:uncharacterized protein SAPINGB_P003860 [Saprochaete ingens]VVT54007.1 unnamed protein product [Saprochaete ingens]